MRLQSCSSKGTKVTLKFPQVFLSNPELSKEVGGTRWERVSSRFPLDRHAQMHLDSDLKAV
jgi:hypothetical protein